MIQNIRYQASANPPPDLLEKFADFLTREIFGSFNKEEFQKFCAFNKHFVCHWAEDANGRICGLKIGYPKDSEHFYSWLGGVAPFARGHGLGKNLMRAQHQWCRENKFKCVSLKTMNRWKEMLLMSIGEGYEIIGTHLDSHNDLKIILLKDLSKSDD